MMIRAPHHMQRGPPSAGGLAHHVLRPLPTLAPPPADRNEQLHEKKTEEDEEVEEKEAKDGHAGGRQLRGGRTAIDAAAVQVAGAFLLKACY